MNKNLNTNNMDYNSKSKEELVQLLNKCLKEKKEKTQSKEAELILKQSDERFRLFFENSPLGYQSLDFDGYFLDVNQAWLDTLGYSREEVIGKWFGDFLTPKFKNGFKKRFPQFKALGKIHSEFEMIHKNGNILFIAFDGKIGTDVNGNFKQTHCVLKDISEQRKIEEELRESETIFSKFLEYSPVYIFFKDREMRSLMLSKNFEQMIGRPMVELIGKSMHDLFPSDFAKKIIADDKKIMNEGNASVIEEDLGGRSFTTIKFPISIDGEPKYLAGFSIDNTEKKKAEKAIHDKALELERFNNLMLGREMTMIELKKEINELLKKAGKKEKYQIHE